MELIKPLVYIYLGFLSFSILCLFAIAFIEKYIDEDHPFKEWWRKNVIENPNPNNNMYD